jgi:hypothetical protein
VTYFNKTSWKDMHAKTPQELLSADFGYFLPAMVFVIFKTEDYLAVSNTDNTMVGYGHPVSVLAKITENMLCRAKGRFTENHPWFAPCSFYLITVMRQKLILGKILLNPVHEPAPELKAQLSNRVKVFTGLADVFHTARNGISKRRNYAMYMRMEAQVLTPCMKYAYGSALNPVMAVAKRAQNIPDGFEQVIIEPLAVSDTDIIQRFRHGENNMIMPHRVRLPDAVFNPECLFCGLAFGTVTVAAGVIAYMFASTLITTILMTAQGCGAAHGQCSKNAEMVTVRIVFTDKILPEHPDYIRHLMLRAAHKASLYRVSKGLWALIISILATCR